MDQSGDSAVIRLTPLRRAALYVVGLGIFGSGALWLAFHYFLRGQGAFGPMPHPGEHWARIAHGGFAFATLWLVGMMWERHVTKAWARPHRRLTGLFLLLVLLVLIVSGYLLYYLGDEALLAQVAMLHWMLGLLAPLAFIQHRLARKNGEASGEAVREPNIPLD